MINGFTSLQKLILFCRCFLCLTFTINLNLQKYKCVSYEKLACVPCSKMASSNITCSYMCQQRALKYTPASIYGTKIISFIVTGLVDIQMFIMNFEFLIFFLLLSLFSSSLPPTLCPFVCHAPEYIFGCFGKCKSFSLFCHHANISIYNHPFFFLFNL